MATSTKSVARPSLSQQIDRLDGILEGLSEALQGSVSTAVKESLAELGEPLRVATREAVRQVLADPSVWPASLTPRPAVPTPSPLHDQTPGGQPGKLVKVALAVESGWRWLERKGQAQLKAGGHQARLWGLAVTQALGRGWQALLALLPLAWMLRWHILIATATGLGWGVLTLMVSPTVGLVLGTLAGSALILLVLIAGNLWLSHLVRLPARSQPETDLSQAGRTV